MIERVKKDFHKTKEIAVKGVNKIKNSPIERFANKIGLPGIVLITVIPFYFIQEALNKKENIFRRLRNGIKESAFGYAYSALQRVLKDWIESSLISQALSFIVMKALFESSIGFVIDLALNCLRIYSDDNIIEKTRALKQCLKISSSAYGGMLVGNIVGSLLPVGMTICGLIGYGIGWCIGNWCFIQVQINH